MIAANLAAPYHTAVAAARQMLAQPDDDGIRGKIVNIGDWATERPYKDYLPYLVAKGGLATLTLALAKELAPHVPVAMIQPAMIDPPPDLTAAEIEAVIAADSAAPGGIARRRQPAHPLPARGHELRDRSLLPRRRRPVSGPGFLRPAGRSTWRARARQRSSMLWRSPRSRLHSSCRDRTGCPGFHRESSRLACSQGDRLRKEHA